jgi:hypothetical protein
MGSGAYLCKYLSKSAQKIVPEGFEGVGRFWAASRFLVPMPVEIATEEVEEPEKIVRTLCKHHEANHRSSRYRKKARTAETSYRLPDSAAAAWVLLGNANHKEAQK